MREIADSVGISVSCLWRWEHGERCPRGDAAARYGRLVADLANEVAA